MATYPESDLNGQAGLADPQESDKLRILVCGSRTWDDPKAIERELAARKSSAGLVIDGAAPGADSMAHAIAVRLGIPTLRFPADWEKYGKSAGHKRNWQMLHEGKPDIMLAFARHLPTSRGTADMVKIARAAGISVFLFER
jgi:YspA, cpYpsA-related SLOG family